jgi:glycosyltransferase involved in cell wall biosynthesis
MTHGRDPRGQSMRVLVLTNVYPNPFQPNRATYNRHQFRLLAERHPVRVIAPILWVEECQARRAGRPPLPPGRRVTLDGLTVDHPRYWYTPKFGRSLYGRFYLWSVRRAFWAAVAEFRPDVLFTPWAYPDGWAAVRLGRRAGLPVVLQVHGSDVRLAGHYAGRVGGTADAVRRADGVVAVSRELAERVARLGADPDRVRVVIDGVDRQTFSPGDRETARARVGFRAGVRHLLFVGSLAPVKGLDVLLDACARLPGRVGPWELHLVGKGNARAELARQADRLGLADRVRFHGGVPHADLPDWFRAADLFVLPSRSEGTPNVLLEAAACGTPFVATAVGGVPDIAHLGASRLAPPEDPGRLAEAVADAIESPPARRAAGPRDRREAVAELADFLTDVVARSRARVDPARATGGPGPPALVG